VNARTSSDSAHVRNDPVVFDPYSTEYFDDPFPVYARLRAEAPVYFNETYGFHALSRYQDVFDASINWQVFSSAHGQTLSDLKDPNYDPGGMIISIDPPQHERLRALVSRAFTPRSVARMDQIVRDVITSVIEPLEDRQSFDVVEDFTAIFPNEIISTILGIPEADRPNVRRWTNRILSRQEGAEELTDETVQAYIAQQELFFALAQEKRRHPADDMMTKLAQAEIPTDTGGVTRLTDKEVADFSFILGAAGTETVTKLVANAIVLLGRHRDQWQLVREDKDLLPAAVEEALRYWAPSQLQGRFTMTDVTLHGVTIPKGSPVFLITGSANRDERVYERPDEFDVTRTDVPAPLGFGRGAHFCIGAALARTESRIALEEFASRWPEFEVDEDGLRRVHMANVAGYSNVPVAVGKAAVT
jgi:cytochrome P450